MRVTEAPDGTVTVDTGKTAKGAATWDGETVSSLLVKADATQRKTWHVFYPADKADVAVAQDGHRDFASKQAVERAAHDFLKNHREIGVMHADGTEGSGVPVESGIHHGPDWVIKAADGSECRVVDGDWVGAIEWSPRTWTDWENGTFRGVSAQGGAVRGIPTPEALAGLRG